LQPVQDANIINQIKRIGEHYRANIANRFLRPALLQLPMDKATWDQLENLTEKIEQFKYQGVHMDELYRQIAAAANFVYIARREIGPVFKNRLIDAATGADKVLRNMAINTFASNVQVFADMVNELFVSLVELDKAAAKGRKPLYTQMPEVGDIGKCLVGDQPF
jgi:protein involved in temperature-dependent protein secretion